MGTWTFGINKTVIHLTKNSVISLSLNYKKKPQASKIFLNITKISAPQTLLILNEKPKVPSNGSAIPVSSPILLF